MLLKKISIYESKLWNLLIRTFINIMMLNVPSEKKYSEMEGKYKEKVKENNELAIDNDKLKSRVKDLTNEIGSIYKSAKSFLKERTSDLKTFRSLFSDLVNKVKEKSPKGEFER